MSAPLPIGYVTREDGTRAKALYRPTPFNTFAEAENALAAMPEGAAKAAANSALYDARNTNAARIQGGALEAGARTEAEVMEAARDTEAHLSTARDMIDRLRSGGVTAEEAAREFDAIIRRQEPLNRRVGSWRENAGRSAAHYADPFKAHDDLVRRLPALRAGRPVVSF